MKLLGQANIEHQERHRDAENTVMQGVDALLETWRFPWRKVVIAYPRFEGEMTDSRLFVRKR
jgi:hypothetical protein